MGTAEESGKFSVENNQAILGQVIGDHANVHIHQQHEPSQTPPAKPIWLVPYRRNPFFTGREALLKRLHDRFTTDRTAVLTQGQAINGLGGIGKTQVAVEYAYRHRYEYHYVLWTTATTHETIIADFVMMAERLLLPERTASEQDKIVASVTHWLATHEKWLLIVDNADALEIVWPFLPTGSNGHLLLTTREQAVGDIESFTVEQMNHAEGMLLLLRSAHNLAPQASLEQASLADCQIVEQIVKEMNGLPLALDQAGAYIEETHCGFAAYLERYRNQRLTLLNRRGRSRRDHPVSVVTTWSLSFQQVEQKNPAAAELLQLCAFLSPNAIPEEIISTKTTHPDMFLHSLATNPLQLDEAISTLRAYSLLQRDAATSTFSMHRLVQTVLRDSMSTERRKQWIQRVISVVNSAFPSVEFDHWGSCERLVPHALLCVTWIAQEQMATPEAEHLLNQTATYLTARARYAEAESLYQQALAIDMQQIGPGHFRTAITLNNLANLYYHQGKYILAETLSQKALGISEQQLESQHPDTASRLNNLAAIYSRQDRYTEAETLYQRALAIREQQSGPEHPDTAQILNNLAALYVQQGKYAEAEPLHQRAFSICEQRLGSEHPEMTQSLNNLAALYFRQGKYTEAEPLYQRALAICEQQLGPEHPDTAIKLNNLAELYKNQSKYAKAEPLYQRALAVREQQLGPEHPDTAQSLNNLAGLYVQQGKYAEAEPLYQRALTIREQQLGSEHSATSTSLAGLAELYFRQGRYAKAEPLYQRTLAICEQQLGPEHPDTAQSLNNLAALYFQQSKYSKAIPLFSRALAICEQQLGSEHPHTQRTQKNLLLSCENSRLHQ